jgi:arylsulfatase A-like enzyme
MLQAMDTEVGRLLDALDLTDTTVFLLGDNGSAYALPTAINSEGKGSIHEGGINVPLIVAGDAVPLAAQGAETAALVHTTDVYATLLELGGAAPPAGVTVHGVSFAPALGNPSVSPRSVVYADGPFNQSQKEDAAQPHMHDVAVRDPRYKLIRWGCEIPDEGNPNRRAFYDLEVDPGEADDLLDPPGGLDAGEEAAYTALSGALDSIAGLPPAGGCPHIDPPPPPPRCGLGFEIALPLALLAARRRARDRGVRRR